MLNKKFGKLTVLSCVQKQRASDGSLLYKCKCDCGNICVISGTYLRQGTKSCGCLRGAHLKNKPANNRIDLSGQKFNKITLIEKLNKRDINRSLLYKAKCDCGKEFIVSGSKVKNGYIKSCGCLQKEKLQEYLKTDPYTKDETGKKYGLLTVLERAGYLHGRVAWKCRCDCGNIVIAEGAKLRQGQLSCGCLKDSKDIYNIKNILSNNHIPFEIQKKFEECQDKRKLPFDLFINNQYIIEYDGIQHFKSTGFISEEKIEIIHRHDLIKNKYCFDNNIPLIRIPYNVKYTLDDLKLETTRFLLTPENEKEYYESRST